jgi:NADPH2:quinone reductase
LAYTTAALGLFKHLPFQGPWAPSKVKTPLLVYGASAATGAFTVKLAALANIHPIIAIAGKSGNIVSSVLDPSKGDVLLDYRIGADVLQKKVRKVAPELHYIVDSVCNNDTVDMLSPLLAPEDSSYVFMLGGPHQKRLPAHVKSESPFAPGLWEPTDPDSPDGPEGSNLPPKAFTHAFFSYLTFALQEGLLKGHPYEVLSSGLASIGEGMVGLRDGKNSGHKYLFRIADTPGLGSI